MNEGIHLELDTWVVPGQIRKANLCRGLGNRYTPAGTEVMISDVAHNTPPPFQVAQNATTVNTRSSVRLISSNIQVIHGKAERKPTEMMNNKLIMNKLR